VPSFKKPKKYLKYYFLYRIVFYIVFLYNVTWMARVLLSNGSVNKPQQQTVFYGVRAATVAMQWFGKHVSTLEAVFSVGSVQKSYLKNKRRYTSVLSSGLKIDTGSSSSCEDSVCD
jgi:hypothetical protein